MRAVLVAALLLLLSACGTQTGDPPGDSPDGDPVTTTGGVAGFPLCAEVAQIRADDSLYRDEPVYGNASDLTEEVRQWAVGEPGFVEIGLDRERNGWITVWVKDADVEGMTEQVAERWPGAVERELLPQGPFRVQLKARDPYPGTAEERTVVDVDLSAPASTATDEQLHLDPALAIPPEPPLVTDGDALHGDQAVRYVYRDDPECEVPTLGPLEGSFWRLADREAAWDVLDGEELTLYPLGQEDDVVIASTQQMDWTFVRLPDGRTCP